MLFRSILTFGSILLSLPFVTAASITFSTSECIVIAQAALSSSPGTLTQSTPLCPGSSKTIDWPLTSGGDGAGSFLAIYAAFNGNSPGCVLAMNSEQSGYLAGRSLDWRKERQLWDNTAGGLLLDTATWQPLSWSVLALPFAHEEVMQFADEL